MPTKDNVIKSNDTDHSQKVIGHSQQFCLCVEYDQFLFAWFYMAQTTTEHYCDVYCDVGGGWSHSNVLFMVLCLDLSEVNYFSTIFCLWCVGAGEGEKGEGG